MATFTKREIEILQHRLDVPDALAQALTDRAEDELPAAYTEDDVMEAAGRLAERLASDDWADLSDVERDTLADCVEGSTWFACMEAEYESYRNGEALAGRAASAVLQTGEKVSALIGREVCVNLC